jgi:hypothetical protein
MYTYPPVPSMIGSQITPYCNDILIITMFHFDNNFHSSQISLVKETSQNLLQRSNLLKHYNMKLMVPWLLTKSIYARTLPGIMFSKYPATDHEELI